MPTIDAVDTLTMDQDHYDEPDSSRPPEQSMFLSRLAEAVLQIPPFIQVYCSSTSGVGAYGLLKSVSRSGLLIVIPASLPPQDVVQITIANCRSIIGKVLYCVKRSGTYRVGIVFMSRHKPEIRVGSLAVVKSLDEPFILTRGNILDVGSSRLSIFCKTTLAPGAWVRVEANGWILFGLVDAVVATSMLACCVDIHLEAAFPAASTALPVDFLGQPRELEEDRAQAAVKIA
jgi:hypothetical protein